MGLYDEMTYNFLRLFAYIDADKEGYDAGMMYPDSLVLFRKKAVAWETTEQTYPEQGWGNTHTVHISNFKHYPCKYAYHIRVNLWIVVLDWKFEGSELKTVV